MVFLERNMLTNNNQIVLKNIYKNFGNINALKNISISTNSGEIHCILGDNGAGKSTLVNIVSGVFRADQGKYIVNDDEVNFSNPREAIEAGISTVYQNLAIIPIMNIYRNFFLGNEPIHNNYFNMIDKEFAINTTKKELRKFDISIDNPKRSAGTLSGGERQRIVLARALTQKSPILILDEPTTGLDPAHRVDLWSLLKKLFKIGLINVMFPLMEKYGFSAIIGT